MNSLNDNEAKSDRHNLVQIATSKSLRPLGSFAEMTLFGGNTDKLELLAFQGQNVSDTQECQSIADRG